MFSGCLAAFFVSVAPRLQGEQHRRERLPVNAQAVFDARRHFGVNSAFDDAVGFQRAQLRGQRALRHRRQNAADFVEAQHAVAMQAVENRAFPLAADNGERGFHRAVPTMRHPRWCRC